MRLINYNNSMLIIPVDMSFRVINIAGKMKKLFAALLLLISFQGCATILKGPTDTVNFTSEPAGANIHVNGINMGKAPIMLQLKSNKTYNIEFRLDEYETKNYILNNSVGSVWILLDILFGTFPAVIDAATGDWFSLDQNQINGVLEKSN
jgi:hypothetical protein